jgi:hypothetical protein
MIACASDILDMVVAAITQPNATDAEDRIFRPGDWPSQDGQYPLIKLRVPREFKQSTGRSGAFEFTVTTTVRFEGQVSAPAQVDDGGAAAVEMQLWRLARQIEIAVIGSYPLGAEIQNIATVDTQLAYSSDSETHLAGVQIDLSIEWFADAEIFAPVQADPIAEIHLEASRFPDGPGFTVELPQ